MNIDKDLLQEIVRKRIRASLLSFALLPILFFAMFFSQNYAGRESAAEPRPSHHVDLQLLYSFLVRGVEDSSLGAPFKAYPIDVDGHHATLVEYPFGSSPQRTDSTSAPKGIALYIHGFNDYFFQREMAEKMDSAGYAFFAVDLHGYGRSIREGEPRSDMHFASEFFAEIDYAVEMGWHLVKSNLEHKVYDTVRDSSNEVITRAITAIKRPPSILVAHSQGGLIASLYMEDGRRDKFGAVVMNSPFLEMNFGFPIRKIALPLIASIGLYFPDYSVGSTGNPNYANSLYKGEKGEWEYNTDWKPFKRPETYLHWVRAIHKAQTKVREGLHIASPILVLHSGCSVKGEEWVEEYTRCDGILDARLIRDASPKLGTKVQTAQIDGALHDVFLSKKEVRDNAYDLTFRFINESLAGSQVH